MLLIKQLEIFLIKGVLKLDKLENLKKKVVNGEKKEPTRKENEKIGELTVQELEDLIFEVVQYANDKLYKGVEKKMRMNQLWGREE